MEGIINDEETVHITTQHIPYDTINPNYEEQIEELEVKNIFLQAKLRQAEKDIKEKERECKELKKIVVEEMAEDLKSLGD